MLQGSSLCIAQPTNQENSKTKEVTMTDTQRNKAVVQQLYEQCLNKKEMSRLDELISKDFTGVRGLKGPAAFAEPVSQLIQAFPDIQWKITSLMAEQDKVMVSWTWQGTNTAPFQNYATTNKRISNDGSAIFQFRDLKIVRSQVQTDRLGFLQQLEVLPQDLAVLSIKSSADEICFIDKFFVPSASKQEFMERVSINRNFIRSLPGFIGDAAYERTDENGNFIFITMARWKNEAAIKNAKEAVQAEYKKQGFDMPAMLERLHITLDRGMYKMR
jgi:steroid delta-isomerase-like uncharacterized protein